MTDKHTNKILTAQKGHNGLYYVNTGTKQPNVNTNTKIQNYRKKGWNRYMAEISAPQRISNII